MFSEKLQNLIDASLVDGVITEKERAVIHKCALQEGGDPDEIDVLLDAVLQKLASSNNPQKHGVIRKCPSCGAIYEAGSVKCPQCGYVFVGVKANNSAKLLFEELANVDKEYRNKKGGNYFLATIGLSRPIEVKLDAERGNVIKNFPVPTTKEDLLEFIPIMEERWKGTKSVSDTTGRHLLDKEKMAYRSKYLECIQKAQMMFGNDKDFAYLFERYNNKNWFLDGIINKLRFSKVTYLLIFSVAFLIIFNLGSFRMYSHYAEEEERKELKEQVMTQFEKLSCEIDSLDTPNNSNYDQLKREILSLSWDDILIKDAFNEEKMFQNQKKEQIDNKKKSYIMILNSFYKKRHKKDDDDLKEYIDKETN